MAKDNQIDKLEYAGPKVVDLQIEQKNTEGMTYCYGGSSNTGICQNGISAGSGCNTGNSG